MNVVLGTAELFVDAHAELAECPVALEGEDALLWIDMPAGKIFRTSASSGATTSHEIGTRIGSIALRDSGGILVASDTRVSALEQFGAPHVALTDSFVAENCRLNDGRVDPWGAFVVGSACRDRTARDGGLYRVRSNGSVTTLLRGLGMANGLDWSPSSEVLYFVDTVTQTVGTYSVLDEGRALAERSVLVEIPRDVGLPDGLTVDADGCIWLALWGAGEVRRFDPSGRHIGTVRVPARLVTSCCFGGQDSRSLFITTARDRSAGTCASHSGGALYVFRTSYAGQPPHKFVQ